MCVDAHFLARYCLNKVALQWVNRCGADSDDWCLCFSILSLTWGVGPFCSLIWKSEYCCSSSGRMAAFNFAASAQSMLSCGQGNKWVTEPRRVCFRGQSLWLTSVLNIKPSGRRKEVECFTPRDVHFALTEKSDMVVGPPGQRCICGLNGCVVTEDLRVDVFSHFLRFSKSLSIPHPQHKGRGEDWGFCLSFVPTREHLRGLYSDSEDGYWV